MRKICSSFFLCALLSVNCVGASFDCHNEHLSKVETAICKDEALSNLDTDLDSVFAVAKVTVDSEKRDDLLKSQRVWLSKRNLCDNSQCLYELYDVRIKELSAAQNVQRFTDDLPSLLKESDGTRGLDQKCRELPTLIADNHLKPEKILMSFRAFLSYVPSESNILDFKCANIKGDGSTTYLLVTRKSGGVPGVLTIFSRQQDGSLRVEGRNKSIIQTDVAGASGGYEGLSFHSGAFTVENSFGSAAGASSFSFTIQYQKSSRTWMLKSADLYDNEGHHHEAPKNIKFQDFDGTGYPIALP